MYNCCYSNEGAIYAKGLFTCAVNIFSSQNVDDWYFVVNRISFAFEDSCAIRRLQTKLLGYFPEMRGLSHDFCFRFRCDKSLINN